MHFASKNAYINSKPRTRAQRLEVDHSSGSDSDSMDLNVFVVSFEGVKDAEKHLAGGDPYNCKQCCAILNKFSKVLWKEDLDKADLKEKVQLGKNEALWLCEFCGNKNLLKIEREQIPLKEDIVYMLQSQQMGVKSQNDSTIVFCIDTSGSMNSTSAVQGKVDLKYGLSKQEIEMLKQFMQPGDEAQFNYLPGAQNHNKTFISRKQCILSAIESQLTDIKATYPYKKIGFVTFGSQVTAIGDSKSETVNIVGDKLYKKDTIIESLANFKLGDPIAESFESLLNQINKIEANGQTALGPALIAAIDIVEKGSPGSSVILCTDGLANVGVGQLQPYDQSKKKFYAELGERAKAKNVTVNIVTIKGEGCKLQAIGQLAQLTNGNIKIVNPDNLSEDFANVLKDEVVGLNVLVKVLLHKGMKFRNQAPENLKDQGRVLHKQIANASKNTRVSFEYDVKNVQDLQQLKVDLNELKTIPFQAQIQYTSPTGGKFLRVVSSQCDTTQEKADMEKYANLGVVHHRITNQTAALYKQGSYKDSQQFNSRWAHYLDKNFQDKKYEVHQNKFAERNERLNKAIKHRHRKSVEKKIELKQALQEEEVEIMKNHSDIESDEDQCELVDNLMERKAYSICKSFHSSSSSRGKKKNIKKEPLKKQAPKVSKRNRSRTPNSGSRSFSSNSSQEEKPKRLNQIKSSVKRKETLSPMKRSESNGSRERNASPELSSLIERYQKGQVKRNSSNCKRKQ